MSSYDENNVFAKILRGEIPCKKIMETEHSLAFHDAFPKRKIHALVIPKGAYTDMDDFTRRANIEEMSDLFKMVGETARALGLDEGGYRVLSNCRENAGQEVPHLHFHIVGGEPVGPLLCEQ